MSPRSLRRLQIFCSLYRLWSKVRFGGGCWEWTGAMGSHNRGSMTILRRRYMPHRVAWLAIGNSLPPGMKVCHRCDNPRCVRPDHLFLGSQADNMRDMSLKGRGRNGFSKDPLHHRPPSRRALTADQVRLVRSRLASGDRRSLIARDLGVSYTVIHMIAHGRHYAEVA